jgi:hypothetical protein
MLSPRMRKYIHCRTMRNFIMHFDETKSERDHCNIIDMLVPGISDRKNAPLDPDLIWAYMNCF